MAENDPQPGALNDERRGEWVQRVEGFARDAAPRTRPFAEALVDFVAPQSGEHVLDIATGSGVVAVEAALRVGPTGSVLATDFVAEWEPYVARTAAEARVKNVSFAVMPAESLALQDESFDIVLCQFGLMFVDDHVHALREMRRVLRPGGRLGLAVWSEAEKVGVFLLSRIVAEALPPPEAPGPSPLALAEPGLLERLVSAAGFKGIRAERIVRTFEIADAAEEWRKWSEDPLSPAARGLAALPADERAALQDKALAALEAFREGESIRLPSEAIFVSATR